MASGRNLSLTSSTPTMLSGTTSTIHAAGSPSVNKTRDTFTSGVPSPTSSAVASSAEAPDASMVRSKLSSLKPSRPAWKVYVSSRSKPAASRAPSGGHTRNVPLP
jgi:hypothetical protein